MTGYQDEESPWPGPAGPGTDGGSQRLKLGQTILPVACSVGTYGLSAHADRMQLVSFIEAVEPQTVVLVHGDQGEGGPAAESAART